MLPLRKGEETVWKLGLVGKREKVEGYRQICWYYLGIRLEKGVGCTPLGNCMKVVQCEHRNQSEQLFQKKDGLLQFSKEW